jgi:hypothetical protein
VKRRARTRKDGDYYSPTDYIYPRLADNLPACSRVYEKEVGANGAPVSKREVVDRRNS